MTGDQVWIVGKFVERTPRQAVCWEFIGVFGNCEKAKSACRDENYFVGPARMNEALPDEPSEWPGAFYPKRQRHI